MTAPAPILRWGSLSEQPFRVLNAPRTFPPWSVPASPSVFRPTWLIASLNSSTSWQTARSGESVNQLQKGGKGSGFLALGDSPHQCIAQRPIPIRGSSKLSIARSKMASTTWNPLLPGPSSRPRLPAVCHLSKAMGPDRAGFIAPR